MKARSIKNRLTRAVVLIVTAAILATSSIIISLMGNNLVNAETSSMQLQAEKFANSINSWIEMEKGLNDGTGRGIEALPADHKDRDHIQSLISRMGTRDELLNLYYGNEEKDFIQTDPAAETPEGYDPTQRGWYKAAKEAGQTVVTDPYMDVLIGGMCITIATPVYEDGALIGVVGADFTLDTISDIVNSIPCQEGEYAYLVDASGNYVMHQNEEYLPGEEEATAVSSVLPALDPIIKDPGSQILKSGDYDGESNYFATGIVEGCGWILGIAKPKSLVMANISQTIVISAIIVVLAFLISSFIMMSLIKKQLVPLETMKSFIRDNIVSNQSHSPKKTEVEEINDMIRDLETQLIDTIRKTKNESTNIRSKMVEATTSIEDINENIQQISNAMYKTEESINFQTDNINNIGNTCSELNDTVGSLTQSTQSMNERAHEITDRVQAMVPTILENKKHAVTVTNDSRQRLEQAIEGVKVIEQIVDVSNAISSIAEQTNLLALNASIEAARAGEAGRGFAVVADEINNLSSTTANEITKVNDLTDKVTESVRDLSNASNEIITFLTEVVLKDYDNLETLANNYMDDAAYYGSISAGFGQNTEDVEKSVNDITQILEKISSSQELLTSAISLVSGNLSTITNTSGDVSGKAQEVLASIETLQGTVDNFKV